MKSVPKLGVKLIRKTYDTRYDPALTASLWPGILSGDKPLLHMGLGGPDVAALMKRLPPGQGAPAHVHRHVWFHLAAQHVGLSVPADLRARIRGLFQLGAHEPHQGPAIRVAIVGCKVSPAYVDGVRGFRSLLQGHGLDLKTVGTEWVQMKPVFPAQ